LYSPFWSVLGQISKALDHLDAAFLFIDVDLDFDESLLRVSFDSAAGLSELPFLVEDFDDVVFMVSLSRRLLVGASRNTRLPERVDNAGTRHRVACRLTRGYPEWMATAVSQDGSVRYVGKRNGKITYWDILST
jgi:hypothetical protein